MLQTLFILESSCMHFRFVMSLQLRQSNTANTHAHSHIILARRSADKPRLPLASLCLLVQAEETEMTPFVALNLHTLTHYT